MKATFDHSEDIAAHIKTFWFKPEWPVRYIAGQYTELYLPHANADNRGERRWLTLSSSPTEPLLGVTTKLATGQRSTFMQTLDQLQPGTQVHLSDPMGDFVLPKDPSIPLVFVAGGIGVTPVRSIVKWLVDKGEQRDMLLIYAVKKAEDLAFEPLFKQHSGLRLITLMTGLTTSNGQNGGEAATLSAEHILSLTNNDARSRIYISGPELMVETLVKDLALQGVDRDRLVGDYFSGY